MGKSYSQGSGASGYHGGMYVSTPAASAAITPLTYVKLGGTTTALALHGFTHSSGRLTYSSSESKDFRVFVTLSVTSSAGNANSFYKVAKNGVVIDSSKITRKIGAGSDTGALAIMAEVNLVTGDYIEIFCDHATSSATITAENMIVFVTE